MYSYVNSLLSCLLGVRHQSITNEKVSKMRVENYGSKGQVANQPEDVGLYAAENFQEGESRDCAVHECTHSSVP